jgi:hypothetical protein
MSTAIVNVRDVRGRLHKCRCLLDSASQVSFITEAMVDVLGLRRTRNYTPLKETNNVASDAKHSVNIQLCSRYNKFQVQVMCFTLPKITGNVPARYIEHD